MKKLFVALLCGLLIFTPVYGQNGLPGGPGAQIPNNGAGAGQSANGTGALKVGPYADTIAWAGTSRIISQYLDTVTQNNKGNSSWINWASGWLRAQGKSLVTVGNFATSGFRTDQFAPAVASALALKPVMLGIDGYVNDIAQLFPAQGTCATTAVANLKGYIKQANDQGVTVVFVPERGAENFTATQIGILNDANQLMADYLAYGDDFRGPPNVIVLDPYPSTVVTSTSNAVDLANTQDGTHDNIVAGQKFGLYNAGKLAPYLRPLPGHRLSSLNQNSGFGARNIWQSAGNTGSVAAGGTGNTGTVPTNSTSAQSGLATAVFSTQASVADADGNTWGNDVKIVATATGAGTVSLIYTLNRTNIVNGSIVRGNIEVDVTAGATGFQGVSADLESFPTSGGPTATYDMFDSGLGTDPGGYAGFVLEPPPLIFGAFVGSPFTNLAIRLKFSAAGSATVLVRKGVAVIATR